MADTTGASEPKIAVYGAGGVGGYFGARLAQAGANVHLIARGSHLEALQQHGLRVESVKGDFELDLSATDDSTDIGTCDYVLFTVKSFDTEGAATDLDPLVVDGTAVISLQNGLDNEEKLAAEIGREHVLGGVAYIFSTIAEPGVIQHTGGPPSFTYGELDGSRSNRTKRFQAWCEKAEGMSAELSETIRTELWEKAAFICAQAGQRVCNAVQGADGVWILEPLDAPGVDALLTDLGEIAGVAVLSDYDARDAAAFADRHDDPVHVTA